MLKKISLDQIAVGNYTYPLYSFEFFLESCLRMEIDTIELWAAGPHLYLEDFDYFMLGEMRRQIQNRRLKAVCLTPEQCAYPVNLGAREEFVRRRSISYFKKAIRAAEVMEIPAVLVTPGNGYRNEESHDTWKYTVENIKYLSDYALDCGVVLYLEHLTEQTTNIAIRAADIRRLIDEVHRKNLVYMVDTDMMSRYGETIRDYIEETGRAPAHVHLVDGMPGGHLALGDGNVPLYDCLEELDEISYKGYMTLEITNDRYFFEPEKAIRKSLEWLRQYIR